MNSPVITWSEMLTVLGQMRQQLDADPRPPMDTTALAADLDRVVISLADFLDRRPLVLLMDNP